MSYEMTSEEYAKHYQLIHYYNSFMKSDDNQRDMLIFCWVKDSNINGRRFKKLNLLLKMIRFEMHEEIRKNKSEVVNKQCHNCKYDGIYDPICDNPNGDNCHNCSLWEYDV